MSIPLFGARASSSSKKTMAGAALEAREKTSRTFSSDWPMYMLSNSGPLTLKKFNFSSVATALANRVFPTPVKVKSESTVNIQ